MSKYNITVDPLRLKKSGLEILGLFSKNASAVHHLLHEDNEKLRNKVLELTDEYQSLDEGDPKKQKALEDIQSYSRYYVRTAFASFETNIYLLKQYAMILPQVHYQITSVDRLLLDDYILKTNGEKMRLRFLDNLDEALKLLCRSFGFEIKLNKGDKGYGLFKGALALRNKLTHPKNQTDVSVPLEEYKNFAYGMTWFYNEFTKVWTAIGERIKSVDIV